MGGLHISTQTARTLSPSHDPFREEANQTNIGELGAKLLLGLNEVYPGARDVVEDIDTASERTLVDQLWSNFTTQGIVDGSPGEGVLTQTGYHAVQGALVLSSPRAGQHPPTGEAAYLFLLGIMRRHFRQEVTTP